MKYIIKIVNIIEETDDSKTFVFAQPNLRRINFLAGQFLVLKLRIEGRNYSRAYSISSSPLEESRISLTIKRVKGGIVSNYILDTFKIDDHIEVSGPFGDFVVDPEVSLNDVYLWAAGSGITPIFSIMKFLLIMDKRVRVTLIYVNGSERTAIFLNEILTLYSSFGSRLVLRLFFTQDKPLSILGFEFGRITKEVIRQYNRMDGLKYSSGDHYVCGPSGFKDLIISELKEIGVPNFNIRFELFKVIIGEEDLVDVVDSVVSLVLPQDVKTLNVGRGTTVLEAFLDQGVEHKYSCLSGQCNECKARLIDGSVAMLVGFRRVVQPNEDFLLCCSYPLTAQVTYKI